METAEDRPEETYPPRVVCRLLNIPPGTLATWASRGFFANFDAAFSSPGKPRMFTRSDFLALALIKKASDGNAMPLELTGFAPDAADAYLTYPNDIRELWIRYFDQPHNMTTIGFNEDVSQSSEEFPPNRATLSFRYNLERIFGDAMRLLVDEARKSVETKAREIREERLSPLLTDVSRTRT